MKSANNSPTQTAEVALMCYCARVTLPPDAPQQIAQLAQHIHDWQALHDMLWYNGVLPLVYTHLKRHIPDVPPAQAMRALKRNADALAQWNMMLIADFVALVAALNNDGVDILPFKGLTLAHTYYGGESWRTINDIDIFVPPDALPTACTTLEKLGYVLQPDSIPENMRNPEQWHHYVYQRQHPVMQQWVMVELHTRLPASLFPFVAGVREFDILWQRAHQTTYRNRIIRQPHHVDYALYLCLHGARSGWRRLQHITDLAQVLARFDAVDWPDLLAKAQQYRVYKLTLLGLHLTQAILAFDLPDDIQASIQQHARAIRRIMPHIKDGLFSQHRSEHPDRLRSQWLSSWYLADTLGQRRRFVMDVWRDMMRPTDADYAWLRLPSSLHFLYAVVRPLRLLLTYRRSAPALPDGGTTSNKANRIDEEAHHA